MGLLAADLAARSFDKVAARFDPRMRDALSVERLGAVSDQIVGGGELESMTGDRPFVITSDCGRRAARRR